MYESLLYTALHALPPVSKVAKGNEEWRKKEIKEGRKEGKEGKGGKRKGRKRKGRVREEGKGRKERNDFKLQLKGLILNTACILYVKISSRQNRLSREVEEFTFLEYGNRIWWLRAWARLCYLVMWLWKIIQFYASVSSTVRWR